MTYSLSATMILAQRLVETEMEPGNLVNIYLFEIGIETTVEVNYHIVLVSQLSKFAADDNPT